MRLIPALTAILVSVTLYFAVFERDRLIAFARGEEAAGASDTSDTLPATEAERAIGVVALRSVAREIDSAVRLRGETRADRQVEVRAETASTVLSEPLRKGQFVEQGDVLCKLDPGTRLSTLAEAQARLTEARASLPVAISRQSEAAARVEEARARLEEAEINDNAARRLSQDGFASDTRVATTKAAVRSAEAGVEAAKSGLESAKSGIESARAGIQSAEAAVAAASKEIERLTITAPFAGLLESDTAELGSLMQPGSLCATVIRLDPIIVVGFVPETEVDRVQVGALAGARLATGQEVTGTVRFLSRSADPTTRTFQVEIAVPNPNFAIRDGQTAEILISAAGTKAHLLPQSSLTLNNEGALGVRSVGDDNRVEFTRVRMLRDTVNGIWVEGLPEQVDVIVVGQDFVTEGVLVTATYREAQE